MSLAITVFAVVGVDLSPLLCQVLLRSVRGVGPYPGILLPKSVSTDGVHHSRLPGTALDLAVWDCILPPDAEDSIQREIEHGHFTVPAESPFGGSVRFTGHSFGPVPVLEEYERASVSGTGLLYRKGLATEEIFHGLRETLGNRLPFGTAPKAFEALVLQIGEIAGLGKFSTKRIFGGIDWYFRRPSDDYRGGPLFRFFPVKPDLRSRDPMSDVRIARGAALAGKSFGLKVTLQNYDEVLRSVYLHWEAGADEKVVSSSAHVTKISIDVFDDTGELVDAVRGLFVQGFSFELSALGEVNQLPPPFPSAMGVKDLEARHRVHTASFEGPSGAGRSRALDVLRKNTQELTSLIGSARGKSEDVWFERSAEGQAEVIRWLKKKMEAPGLRRAYLVDPFLGSDALMRVLLRHGNETAELLIVVSPGKIDPDAETTDAKATNDHLEKLKATATEWNDQLAGAISIVHVKRGSGSKQAFHDRYFCIIDQRGRPTAYLLSNSLSKAAGAWPFAICELDQVTSWRVYGYIFEITERPPEGYEAQVIWKRTDVPTLTPSPVADNAAEDKPDEPKWLVQANAFLTETRNIIFGGPSFQQGLAAHIDTYLNVWPDEVPTDKFVDAFFDIISHREAFVLFAAEHFKARGRDDVAEMLDERLFAQILQKLPEAGKTGNLYLLPGGRAIVLEKLATTIARKPKATDFLREEFNPRVNGYLSLIETQRFDHKVAWDALQSALVLASVALRVAVLAAAKQSYRIFLAIDYIHCVGRLVRSQLATEMYGDKAAFLHEFGHDLTELAEVISKARQALGPPLDESIALLKADPYVLPAFRRELLRALSSVAPIPPDSA